MKYQGKKTTTNDNNSFISFCKKPHYFTILHVFINITKKTGTDRPG